MSKRKPHNEDAGYVAEKIFTPTGSRIVIYVAAAQGIDAGRNKYAVVCSLHGTMIGTTSIARSRPSMKYPEFCEQCMNGAASTVATSPAPVMRYALGITATLHGRATSFEIGCDTRRETYARARQLARNLRRGFAGYALRGLTVIKN